ncbi:type I-U CRISPR-associated protein Csb2 [Dokdonella sp.]|uniref:type I-G CRISPR-associated protein Csb2 n=1 Tax=Dokdonella sp. TaxID=2291710 RepID=UPI0031C9F7BA|nr:type I-U CRISPR-associated protein Csb2 [Dokdonella sp.]
MRIVLRQEFPLGRFHATLWRANPFDDPHGEWPPSPWRLVRAVTARWYQWAREAEREPDLRQLEKLQSALCKSTYAFHLPPDARKGTPLRQYHPTEFAMDAPNWRDQGVFVRAPKVPRKGKKGQQGEKELSEGEKKIEKQIKDLGIKKLSLTTSDDGKWTIEIKTLKQAARDEASISRLEKILGQPTGGWQRIADAGVRSYQTSLVQDNYWCVPSEAPVWWFIEGDDWVDELQVLLARCLERMTYFGRAETLTRIRMADSSEEIPRVNCMLVGKRTAGAVPVLSPLEKATREDIERTSDNPAAAKRAVPPGAQWLYTVRPQRPAVRERRRVRENRRNCHLMQFAIGWNVAPDPRAIVRLTSRFRGMVVNELIQLVTEGSASQWTRADRATRECVASMVGKDADGKPDEHRRHTEFMVWFERGRPSRLLVWRGSHPFSADEQEAILFAARKDFSWTAIGSDVDDWRVRLVPLDAAVPLPPGFDGLPSRVWESITPYVPSRHRFRGTRERSGESVAEQICRELTRRGISEPVSVEIIEENVWVSVHAPRRQACHRPALGQRRAYRIRLRFAAVVEGPIRIGHSSCFGLGLFRPV